MRMRGSSHPGTEVLIHYNFTPTGTPEDPGPGCQVEPHLPHHVLSDTGSQSRSEGTVSCGQREGPMSGRDSR